MHFYGESRKGRELLKGLIAQAEWVASEVAMPFTEVRKPAVANVLLASADPLAHLEQTRQRHCEGPSSAEISKEGCQGPPQRLEDCGDLLQWEPGPAEAWSLLCVLYDIESRVMSKASCYSSVI